MCFHEHRRTFLFPWYSANSSAVVSSHFQNQDAPPSHRLRCRQPSPSSAPTFRVTKKTSPSDSPSCIPAPHQRSSTPHANRRSGPQLYNRPSQHLGGRCNRCRILKRLGDRHYNRGRLSTTTRSRPFHLGRTCDLRTRQQPHCDRDSANDQRQRAYQLATH